MIDYYVGLLSDPDALRGSFGFYRAFDATVAQNEQRKNQRLTMPVLAIGGAASCGEHVGEAMKLVADDVQSVVIPGAGHWVAEEAPERDAGGADRVPGPVPRRLGRGGRLQPARCHVRIAIGITRTKTGRRGFLRRSYPGASHGHRRARHDVEKGDRDG